MKRVLIIVIFAVLFIGFYWYQIRPTRIVSLCQKTYDDTFYNLAEINSKYIPKNEFFSKVEGLSLKKTGYKGSYNELYQRFYNQLPAEEKSLFEKQSPTIAASNVLRNEAQQEFLSCLRRNGIEK